MNYKLMLFTMMTYGVIAQVPLIPRAVLFDNPSKVNVQISPQGNYISYCAPHNGVMNIYIQRRDDYKSFHPAQLLTAESVAVRGYFWSYDEKNIFFSRDNDGDENTQIMSIDLKSNRVAQLTPVGVKARVTAYEEEYPDTMLISMNQDDPALFDLYSLNLKNKQFTLLERNTGKGLSWLVDNNLTVRGLFAVTEDGGKELLKKENDAWLPWIQWDHDDALGVGPINFSADNRYLYCSDSRGYDTARLIKIDCATNEESLIAYDAEADVESCVFQPRTGKLQAICWTKERDVIKFFDSEYEQACTFLGTIDQGDCIITTRTLDDKHWIVAFVKDNGPTTYYYYNRVYNTVYYLGDSRPELRDYTLTEVEPMSCLSRDGLTLHGYISYPAETERKNLPLILYVHGGPWLRDTWGYNPNIQLFTNRGYACLQINYRGSLGYGKKFLNAGDKQWAHAMHDDLVDAVNWAVSEGIADPAKIAIYGGSYGGYAALVGATHTPDLFCCAVDIVGPSNLLTFIRSIPPYWKIFLEDMYRRVGHPDADEEFLKSCSPLFSVDKIKIPLLIAQGAHDPRVKQAESEQIVAALQEKGIPYTYLLFPDEGHGFAKPENRLKFTAVSERFLADNLGGRCEE